MSCQSNRDYTQGFVRGIPLSEAFDFKDKARAIRLHTSYMLCRTMSMFEWEGLPDTVPQRSWELFLQGNGSAFFTEHEGKYYAFTGGMGGEPNVYYLPTLYTVANPALKLSKSYKIGEEGVLVKSDSLYLGLLPMFSKYATQLAENELSMNMVDIQARIVALISAAGEAQFKAAQKYLQDIIKGELGVVADSAFIESIKAQPISAANNEHIVPLIEYEQYLKASWLNDIGLNANFNMKREAINSSESSLNQDALLPLVDDMLRCRQEGADEINKLFGLNIRVKLSSSWEDNQQEVDAEHVSMLVEAGVDTSSEEPVEEEPVSREPVSEEPESIEEKADELVELAQEVAAEVAQDESEEVKQDELGGAAED